MHEADLVRHKEPIHRNNYRLDLGVFFEGNYSYQYCSNNKKWICLQEGMEIGELTVYGIAYALSLCNPESEIVKDFKLQLNKDY